MNTQTLEKAQNFHCTRIREIAFHQLLSAFVFMEISFHSHLNEAKKWKRLSEKSGTVYQVSYQLDFHVPVDQYANKLPSSCEISTVYRRANGKAIESVFTGFELKCLTKFLELARSIIYTIRIHTELSPS